MSSDENTHSDSLIDHVRFLTRPTNWNDSRVGGVVVTQSRFIHGEIKKGGDHHDGNTSRIERN